MKRIFLSALIGVGMVVLILPPFSGGSAAGTPEDYPLVCRGGESLVIGIAPGERNIGFVFTRGTKPAGEGLGPGECSWKDRGMYPAEPDRLSQHVEEGSDSLKVGGTLAPENRWYEELHSQNKYWTFMVSNNGRGHLIATSARPNPIMGVSPTARLPSQVGEILTPRKPLLPIDQMNEGIRLHKALLTHSSGTARAKPGGDGGGVQILSGVADRLSQKVGPLTSVLSAKDLKPPEVFDNLKYQTGFRDQEGRGTCTYFAAIGALEAAYKRAGYPSDIDLSEQYFCWIRGVSGVNDPPGSPVFGTTSAAHRDDILGSVSGGGVSYNFMLLTHYSVPPERSLPYVGTGDYDNYKKWPSYAKYGLTDYRWDDPNVPQTSINSWNFDLDQNNYEARGGARYGVAEYAALSKAQVSDAATLEFLIASGRDVAIGTPVWGDVWAPDPAKPCWKRDPKLTDPVGGHAILLVGYDRKRQFFIAKNSWGAVAYDESKLADDWKDVATKYKGYTLVDYGYVKEFTDGAYITKVSEITESKHNLQRVFGQWDCQFLDKSTGSVVLKGALTWRHLPHSFDTLFGQPDLRVGDFMDDTGRITRVNGEVAADNKSVTLYMDLDDGGLGYTEGRGVVIECKLTLLPGNPHLESTGVYSGAVRRPGIVSPLLPRDFGLPMRPELMNFTARLRY
ncbi:MAG: C1 family peptidase [Pyrinomonadaceae bacterium]